MAWENFLVDLNIGQDGADLSLMAPYIAGVHVRLGGANIEDPNNPIYDESCARHIQKAYDAKIPLVGISYSLDANMWSGGGWQVPLNDVKTQVRTKNPNYVFIKNFLTPQKYVHFITLVLGSSTTNAMWNFVDMVALIDALEAGMKAGEIQPLKIVVASTALFVKDHMFDDGQKINLLENYFYKPNFDKKIMIQEAASLSGSYSWENLKITPPVSKAKPSAYLGAYENPWFWAWCFSGIYLPFNATSNRQFGLSSFWNTKKIVYDFFGVKEVIIPPPQPTCDAGFHWDASQQKCVADTVPPVVHTCPSGEHWDETLQKCVDDTPPVGTVCQEGYHWDSTQNKCVEDVIVEPLVIGGVLFDEKKLSACLKILGDALIAMSDVYK